MKLGPRTRRAGREGEVSVVKPLFAGVPLSGSKSAGVCPVSASVADKIVRVMFRGSLAILVGSIAVGTLISAMNPKSESQYRTEQNCSGEKGSWSAVDRTKDFVTEQLIAPSTVSFPSRGQFDVFWDGKCFFKVNGYVDAQNAYGAQIRRSFVVGVSYSVDKDKWELVSFIWK
jgi:hypothetical protein